MIFERRLRCRRTQNAFGCWNVVPHSFPIFFLSLPRIHWFDCTHDTHTKKKKEDEKIARRPLSKITCRLPRRLRQPRHAHTQRWKRMDISPLWDGMFSMSHYPIVGPDDTRIGYCLLVTGRKQQTDKQAGAGVHVRSEKNNLIWASKYHKGIWGTLRNIQCIPVEYVCFMLYFCGVLLFTSVVDASATEGESCILFFFVFIHAFVCGVTQFHVNHSQNPFKSTDRIKDTSNDAAKSTCFFYVFLHNQLSTEALSNSRSMVRLELLAIAFTCLLRKWPSSEYVRCSMFNVQCSMCARMKSEDVVSDTIDQQPMNDLSTSIASSHNNSGKLASAHITCSHRLVHIMNIWSRCNRRCQRTYCMDWHFTILPIKFKKIRWPSCTQHTRYSSCRGISDRAILCTHTHTCKPNNGFWKTGETIIMLYKCYSVTSNRILL